ncbi:MAG: hypothetical protein JWN93_778 [Hyphomicrobiales bacterium]|nr:hypothetical protein [Hyphomicrobiales bacterium]
MRRRFPFSIVFFLATGVLFVLQAIPIVGIFLMFALAMFWSVALVNAGMLGVAFEAAVGRVSRWWLALPVVFYGGYLAVAAQDHATLRRLSAAYEAANARVATGFDPAREALVFEKDGSGPWLTQNYALPVAYSVNDRFPEGFLSHRMMDSAICTQVREAPALGAAFVHAFGFHDGDGVRNNRIEKRFCALSMPERPELALVRVSRQETKTRAATLPITRVATTVSTPDGRRFELLGGVAAPLSWIPMPVMGCGLNSGAPSWDCSAGFWRKGFTPIVSGATRFGRDAVVLAGALGLKRVAVSQRVGADPGLVLQKIAAVEEATLARQLASVDAMIADPLARVVDWQVGVLASRPAALHSRADAIMTGLERAAQATGGNRAKARESGRILAGLLAGLRRNDFLDFGPRLLALYGKADDQHWLWDADRLLRRLGELGPGALPILVAPRASRPSVNGAGVEGLCRVGAAGREVAEPALLAMWTRPEKNLDRDRRAALFVAMRRVGVSAPPIADDQRERLAKLEAEWDDVSPASPSRVCAVSAERQARGEEKIAGRRRTNLD